MNSNKIKKTMNKISVIITTFLFIFIITTLIFNLVFNNIIVSKYCSEVQKQSVILKMDQSKKIFEFQLKTLDSVVQDYAIWDEIYNKIQEENIDKTWFDINYSKWLPEKLDIDLIIVSNRNKEIILEYGLNGNTDTILNVDNISRLFNENNSVYEFNNSYIIGSAPLIDICGNDIGYINIIYSTDIFSSTQKLIQRNLLLFMIISSIFLFILSFKFKGIIVDPIKQLEKQIKSMEYGNSSVNIRIKGPNEIVSLAKSFNNLIDNICKHKKENEVLRINSNIDPLTNAYNHKYYFESINNMIIEGHKQIAVLFCDIDKFKLTNDTYGHEAGDILLIQIAKIIKNKVKDNGMVFRYGGEEFVIIIPDINPDEAFIEAEKVRKSIARNQVLQQYSDYFPITLSIGIASYPNYGLDAETLIKNADIAMYYSKQNGRNQCTLYTNELNSFFEESKSIQKKELLMDSALSLAEAVDAKDHYTGKHSKMVSKYSILVAEKLNFTEEEKNKLRIGALLHDCGKIGIPDNIINKPDKLSDDEFEIIKNHTLLGNNIIKHITNDIKIIHCVRSHHERWDGKGYPDGLSGNSIDLFARIVCIADVYHSMTSDRPYREALTDEKVLEEFIKGKGTQFDPMLVDIVVEMISTSQSYRKK